MTIEIPKDKRSEVIASLQRYFEANMEEKIGNMTADVLLQELGPVIYNKAVADVQARLQARIMEVDMEVYEEEFQYWDKQDRKRKK
ncbi:MAG: DUF2164 domain-containing protein [Gallionellaceae bacterium]|jgi:uncharacterized protein (DUF2164 family)